MEVAIGDAKLYVERGGDGPPVLLIHGAGGYAGLMEHLAGDLREDFQVVNYDRRGFTRSHHKPARKLDMHADDAAGLIDAALGGKALVVGWSAGANVALALAARYPKKVHGLVLCEPSFLLRPLRLETLSALFGWTWLRMTGRSQKAAEKFYRWVSQYRGTDKTAFDLYEPGWKRAMIANHKPLFAEARIGSGAGGEALGPSVLAGIECPVHVLEGDKTIKPFQSSVDYLRRAMPNAEHTLVAGASHMIPTDAHRDVAAAVRAMAVKLSKRK